MNMTPETYMERLISVSSKKKQLLLDMLLLTKAQAETINEDGIDDLDKLISDKQSKIDEIDKLDEEFGVYFFRLKRELGIKSLDELRSPGIKGALELKECIGQIMDIIKEISCLEQHNSAMAKGLLNNFGHEIKKINEGKKTTNAYGQSPVIQAPSYFVDKKK